MANINVTSMATAIKTLYEKRLLTRLLPRMLYGRWGTVARINQFGSYELRRYESLSVVSTALTDGTTPDENAAPTITKVTLTPIPLGV